MGSAIVPDIWHWSRSLPNPKHWKGESYSLQICNSPSTNQSLNLIVSWHSETQSFNLSYSICAELHDPISLWSSHYSRLKSVNGSDVAIHFLHDIICGVLSTHSCTHGLHLRSSFHPPSRPHRHDQCAADARRHAGCREEANAYRGVKHGGAVDAVAEPRHHQLDHGDSPVRWHAGFAFRGLLLRCLGEQAVEGGAVLPGGRHDHGAPGSSDEGREAAVLAELPASGGRDPVHLQNHLQGELDRRHRQRRQHKVRPDPAGVRDADGEAGLRLRREALPVADISAADAAGADGHPLLDGEPVDGQPRPGGGHREGPRRVAGRGAGDHRHHRVGAQDGDEDTPAMEVRALGARQHGGAELVPARWRGGQGGVLQRAAQAGAAPAAVVVQEPVHQPGQAVHEGRRRDLRRRRVR